LSFPNEAPQLQNENRTNSTNKRIHSSENKTCCFIFVLKHIEDFARNFWVCIYDYICVLRTRLRSEPFYTHNNTTTNKKTNTLTAQNIIIIIYTPKKPLTFLDSLLRWCVHG